MSKKESYIGIPIILLTTSPSAKILISNDLRYSKNIYKDRGDMTIDDLAEILEKHKPLKRLFQSMHINTDRYFS